ncbi:hypothetical protein A9R05_21985 [Burkholderia sp. KK1]|nr:hypothetical protein A9R05_21985 [Burkholderia sp. KK1]
MLPGFKLTHTVHLVSDSNLSVISEAADVLKSEGIEVDHWTVVRRGDVLEQNILLGDMSEARASQLRTQLATLEGILRTRLEHHFSSQRSLR